MLTSGPMRQDSGGQNRQMTPAQATGCTRHRGLELGLGESTWHVGITVVLPLPLMSPKLPFRCPLPRPAPPTAMPRDAACQPGGWNVSHSCGDRDDSG